MATFEKRGDLQWRAKIRRRGSPAQSKTFDTKKEAQRWARDIEREMDQGVFLDQTEAERSTLAHVIERYISEITPLKKGAKPEASRLTAMSERAISDLRTTRQLMDVGLQELMEATAPRQ